MYVTDGESNYDKVCKELIGFARGAGVVEKAPMLLGSIEDGMACMPLFGEKCCVGAEGVYKGQVKLDAIGSILVVRYLLQAGNAPMANKWLPYRDLKDGAQFSSFIKANIEDRIAHAFRGRRDVLAQRLSALGASAAGKDLPGDVALVVHPLPKVPVLSLFWDADEEFPASFQFLFDASALSYLDLEALAVVLQYIYLKLIGEA